jgi:DNA-directed RNA polymerase specialized sigma24 family protein
MPGGHFILNACLVGDPAAHEVGEVLGIGSDAVFQRLHRGRVCLKKAQLERLGKVLGGSSD